MDSTTESVVVVVVVVDSVDSIVAGHARSGVAHGRDMLTSRDVTDWFPSVWGERSPASRSPSIGLPIVFIHEWMIGWRRLRGVSVRARVYARVYASSAGEAARRDQSARDENSHASHWAALAGNARAMTGDAPR